MTWSPKKTHGYFRKTHSKRTKCFGGADLIVSSSPPPKDVVELMQSSLFDLFEDEYGNLDFRRTTGVSKSGQVKAFVQALSKVAARESNSVFTKLVRPLLAPSSRLRNRGRCVRL